MRYASLRLRHEVASRADSIARLSSARELAAALRRADSRFIGIEEYNRVAPGAPYQDRLYPKQDAMHVGRGNEQWHVAPEVGHLKHVGREYAEKHNTLLQSASRRTFIVRDPDGDLILFAGREE